MGKVRYALQWDWIRYFGAAVIELLVEIGEILALFMELQTLGDRNLQKLAFSHVIHTIRRMNQKHKNEARNRSLQNILFPMLQEEDEAKAKRALVTLSCFHTSPKIMIAAL
ncbi:hypothetical protein POM88_020739 [Heracleum sosnowskyi]|uniref:Protein SDA1 n=1 Tax=Heracleum sosnowskyi TaxID=360622 RepID=A0AAD8IC40_9APIA|nr:hypothetical protein POM88_020739 [Heracleum sosnowskyi]